jgi:hypothetical protein
MTNDAPWSSHVSQSQVPALGKKGTTNSRVGTGIRDNLEHGEKTLEGETQSQHGRNCICTAYGLKVAPGPSDGMDI